MFGVQVKFFADPDQPARSGQRLERFRDLPELQAHFYLPYAIFKEFSASIYTIAYRLLTQERGKKENERARG